MQRGRGKQGRGEGGGVAVRRMVRRGRMALAARGFLHGSLAKKRGIAAGSLGDGRRW